VVGAEISGPALPRFTSGVAAARLVKEAALHERHCSGIENDLRRVKAHSFFTTC
jgi:hypothetical protein